MRTGFFGGSFDPAHWGHLAVGRAALRSFGLDRVLLAPVAVQPLKQQGAFAEYTVRLQMVEILCRGEDRLIASDIDAPRENGSPNYTVDTLRKLRDAHPLDELFSIVGIDSFLTLRRWSGPDELLRVAQWIVVSRPGSSFDRLAELALSAEQKEQVHPLDSLSVPVSATEIRARLGAGEPCTGLLPDRILTFIQTHHLYGT